MKISLQINGVKSAKELCASSVKIREQIKAKTANSEVFLTGSPGLSLTEFEFDAIEIFSVKNCIVMPSGAVVTSSGWAVAETLEGSLSDNGIAENGIVEVEIAKEFMDPIYCTSKFGTFNYSVFLHEVLPAIYVAASRPDYASGFTLGYANFVSNAKQNKFKELYSPFYDPGNVIDISGVNSFCNEALVVATGARKNNLQRIKRVMPSLVSEFALSLDPGTNDAPERIYVMRERGSIRELENREQVVWWARQNGFACIELADLSFSEQASYFRNASIIFAEHGAGLANLWYCKKGVRVFEVFPDKLWGRWLYRAISSISGFEYVATSFETPEKWVWNKDPITLPISVLDKGLGHFEGHHIR